MIFSDGRVRSMESILKIFEDFGKMSGLKINLQKSTLFLGGFSEARRGNIVRQFPLICGTLPVRYLGLPLLTKRMSRMDYAPLIEKIKQRISSWTN